MQTVQLREAKAKLSALIDNAQVGDPSIITRHGRPEAVVLSFAEWERLSRVPSFAEMIINSPFEPGDVPDRDSGPLREVDR